jgi:cytosine/adenosine deaminase-related metal-dependent hydrolase
VIGIFERFRKAGVKVITSHVAKNTVFGEASTVELLHSYGLLRPDLVLSHATNLTPAEHTVLHAAGVHVSSTPSSEAQTALGWPVALRSDVHGSLGVDSHAFCGSSILSEARTALLLARQETNAALLDKGEFPQRLVGGAREAFNLATVGGARAVGMGDKIGRVREGFLADLVVVDGRTPGMVGVSGWDPVVAVVGHSGVRDMETVVVDGVVRKNGGKLVGIELEGGERMEWDGVAERVERSREEVQRRIEGVDLEAARKLVVGMWHVDESKIKAVEY